MKYPDPEEIQRNRENFKSREYEKRLEQLWWRNWARVRVLERDIELKTLEKTNLSLSLRRVLMEDSEELAQKYNSGNCKRLRRILTHLLNVPSQNTLEDKVVDPEFGNLTSVYKSLKVRRKMIDHIKGGSKFDWEWIENSLFGKWEKEDWALFRSLFLKPLVDIVDQDRNYQSRIEEKLQKLGDLLTVPRD